eukprot:1161934_1
METDILANSSRSLLQPKTKQYNTFQVVNPKKHPSRGIFSKIAGYFHDNSPSSSSTSMTASKDTCSNDTIYRHNMDCPSKRTYYLFYFNILSCSISFTLIIPSLWYYLHELHCTEPYLALCISIYAMGELSGSYLASMMKNKYNTKFLLILSVTCGIIGGFVYGTAGLLHYYYTPYSLLLGRTLQGVWTGIEQFTETKYISDNVDTKLDSNELTTISFISCIGFILGNMLCGYFMMTLCTLQLLMICLLFDNKSRIVVPKRKEYTRTLTIQPRNHTVMTLSIPLPSDTTPRKYNDICMDNITPPPPPSKHGTGLYPKKQRMKVKNGYHSEDVLNFDSASPISSRQWLASASPPSRISNIGISTASYLSLASETTFHRTSVAEMLNINTASCTPYTPSTPPHPIHTNDTINSDNPLSLQVSEVDHDIRIKYVRSYTSFNQHASVAMTFCFLIHFEAFSIQQTMTSYMIHRQFGWDVGFAHFLFVLCGVIWLSSFYVINNLLMVRSVTHNALVQISLIMGVVSTCCVFTVTLFPGLFYNGYLFIFGFILISFTFPFGRASVLCLYCLCTNYEHVEWIYLMSMISRIVTPFIGVALYRTNSVTSWMYGNVTVLFMIAVLLCSLTTSSANKHKIKRKTNVLYHGYSIINIPQVFYVTE